MMKNILCFGDSNTWGWNYDAFDPDTRANGRFDEQTRWTGRLQTLLGGGYRIIEGGLNGRTSMFPDPQNPNRLGTAGMKLMLETFAPLDLVVIMLGTNDVKGMYNASPGAIASGVGVLAGMVNADCRHISGHNPKTLIVSPLPLSDWAATADHADWFDEESVKKSRDLAKKLEMIAKRNGAYFVDAAQIRLPCAGDGVHLTAEGHKALAELLEKTIRTIL